MQLGTRPARPATPLPAGTTGTPNTPSTQGTPSTPSTPSTPVRARLRTAACALLAVVGAPGVLHAGGSTPQPADPTLRIEVNGLLYAERARTTVAEPVARITRLYANGQKLSAQFALDMMTGASPTGANPAGVAQTTTSASGTTTTRPADQIPTAIFKDLRGALDLAWERPFGIVTPGFSTHYSREKDYQSLGASGKLSLDLDQRLTTLTVGGGSNRDRVFPQGGIAPGLTTGVASTLASENKQVETGLVGVSRVLSRRWLAGVTLSRTWERGYLTEPYKVVSLLNASTGRTTGALTEKRPDRRQRMSVLANSVYHLSENVVYVSYRFYSDDWNVRSHTIDLRYRITKGVDSWLEPHARVYTQGAADFFHPGLVQGRPLPAFATADRRLGELRTLTFGATYGFHLLGRPGEWTVRAEYMGQFGNSHPDGVVGVQRNFDLAPPMHVGSLVIGWTLER